MNVYYLRSRYSVKKDINWGNLVTKITFVLYDCNAFKEYIAIEIIADQTKRTYPDIFLTLFGEKKIIDTHVIVIEKIGTASVFLCCFPRVKHNKFIPEYIPA